MCFNPALGIRGGADTGGSRDQIDQEIHRRDLVTGAVSAGEAKRRSSNRGQELAQLLGKLFINEQS